MAVNKSPYDFEIGDIRLIKRDISWEILGGLPIGRVVCLHGVPKIGKTSMVIQLSQHVIAKECQFEWMRSPRMLMERESEAELFERDLLQKLLSCIFDPTCVDDYLSGRCNSDSLLCETRSMTDRKKIIVVDDAQFLPDSSLIRIRQELKLFADQLHNSSSVGLILISTKSLKKTLGKYCDVVLHPDWTLSDLAALLTFNNIKDLDNRYVNMLNSFGHGHPRIIIALARKYPTPAELVQDKLQIGLDPSIDEDLHDDVKGFLFDDILRTDAERNCLITLSSLAFDFSIDMGSHIMSELHSDSGFNVRLFIERELGTVFETSTDGRVRIADIYKDCAAINLTWKQRSKVYSCAAKYLLPKAPATIDIFNACNGIFYYASVGNFMAASLWTNLILHELMNGEYDPSIPKWVLAKLDFLHYYVFPKDRSSLGLYLNCIIGLAQANFHFGDYSASDTHIKYIEEGLVLGKSKSILSDADIAALTNMLIVSVSISYLKKGDLVNSVSTWARLREDKGGPFDMYSEVCCNIVAICSSAVNLACIPVAQLLLVANRTSSDKTTRIRNLTEIFDQIGSKLGRNKDDLDAWASAHEFPEGLPIVLERTVRSRYSAEIGDFETAVSMADRAIDGLARLGGDLVRNRAHLVLLQADNLFSIGRPEESIELYREAQNQMLPSNRFGTAWCNYRLGMLEVDQKECARLLLAAAEGMKKIENLVGYGKALGEYAVLSILMGDRITGLKSFKELFDQYYKHGQQSLGAAVAVTANILSTISFDGYGRHIDVKTKNGGIIYGLRRLVFADAHNSIIPIGNKVIPYGLLSKLFLTEHDRESTRDCWISAVNSPLSIPFDINFFVPIVYSLHSSFKDKAEGMLSGVRRLKDQENTTELLICFGSKMLEVWLQSSWTRITETDLKYWRALGDRAKAISSSSLSEDQKSAVMLLSLLMVCDEESSKEFIFAREFTDEILESCRDDLPEDIRRITAL